MTEELVEAAREAATRAYAPFSNFRVGAVVVGEDGTRYTGCNVENGALGSSICAEASAIASAVSAGVRAISTIAVSCLDAETDGGYPCGNCRQLMNEFGVETVIVDDPSGARVHTLEELLPYGFRL